MSTMQRTAWLFTKDQQSVRIELCPTSDGMQLTIEGPGNASSAHDFPPGTSVERFRQEYERTLVEDGYKLQVIAERRGDPAPSGARERRRKRDTDAAT
jgi:hypothetical protein